MKDKAIARITDEMMKINTPLARYIEEHLTEICTNEKVAEKLLNKEKTLKKICNDVIAEAGKHKSGNVGMISDADVLQMARDYYGITSEDMSAGPAEAEADRVDVLDLF